jgi:photosystem II stability/assembly factor-like uncharacterized protein
MVLKRCSVFLALAMVFLNYACRNTKWELIRTDSLSDGVMIEALVFTDTNLGWALTPGELLRLSDKGTTWSTILSNPGTERTFYSLAFTSPSTGFIVGAQRKADAYTGLILRTTDSGNTWQESSLNLASVTDIHIPHGLHSISFCSPNVGWAVGSDLIVGTTDGGKSWEIQRSDNTKENLFNVACLSPERAWIVGAHGLILRTTDAGKTWTHQDSGTELNLMRVRFFGNDGWIVGGMPGNSLLLRSRDGGTTWQRAQINTSALLFDVYVNGTQGCIVGAEGTILHTNDGGESWQQQKSPTDNDLNSLFFLNPQQGWAGGAKRTLLRFSD